jgi:hypothetical protein
MARIPYDIVVIEANRIIIRMALAPAWETCDYWDLYVAYIEVCGWTDQEFDRETLRRIDAAWENYKRKIWN